MTVAYGAYIAAMLLFLAASFRLHERHYIGTSLMVLTLVMAGKAGKSKSRWVVAFILGIFDCWLTSGVGRVVVCAHPAQQYRAR